MKTKYKTIVVNILELYTLEELHDDLAKSNFLALSMVASNKKEITISLLLCATSK